MVLHLSRKQLLDIKQRKNKVANNNTVYAEEKEDVKLPLTGANRRLIDVLPVQHLGYNLVSLGFPAKKVILSFSCASEVRGVHKYGLEIPCGQRDIYPCLYTLPSSVEHKKIVGHKSGFTAVFFGLAQNLPQFDRAHALQQRFVGAHAKYFHRNIAELNISLQNLTTNGLKIMFCFLTASQDITRLQSPPITR